MDVTQIFNRLKWLLWSRNRPLNIYLVRHGQSQANVNHKLHETMADHAIRLTPKGVWQAEDAGAFLASHLMRVKERAGSRFGKIRVWHSPYYRARETAGHILVKLGEVFDPRSGIVTYREEPFLMEQKAGLFDGKSREESRIVFPVEAADFSKHEKHFGFCYAIAPMGESRMTTAVRNKHLSGTILRDYELRNIRHVVIVSHGIVTRTVLMGWMRYAPEWLDAEMNPGNCWVRHVHGTRYKGYADEGYVFGEDAPLFDPMATQKHIKGADKVFMLAPQRPNAIVPRGIKVFDPFAKRSG
ncbi:MAG: histidine phosphatase family protein [Alphaproteobacteria bacterium]|nr:histidine phosphatase family protein [Alphaproteobacteria bacterium]